MSNIVFLFPRRYAPLIAPSSRFATPDPSFEGGDCAGCRPYPNQGKEGTALIEPPVGFSPNSLGKYPLQFRNIPFETRRKASIFAT